VRQAWALPFWLDALATERLPMNPSANPDTTPSTAEDTAESSLVGQDTPGSPDGTSVMPPAPGKNKAPPDPATGHYGPGYGDPTPHQGNDAPLEDRPRT